KDQARVARDREELNAYAIAINEVRQPLGMTIHDAIGRISTLDASLPPAPVPRIDATTLSGVDLDHLLDVAGQLGRNWGPVIRGDDFLWRDLREASPLPTYQAELRQTVDQTR